MTVIPLQNRLPFTRRAWNPLKLRGLSAPFVVTAVFLLSLVAFPVSAAESFLEPGVPITGALTPDDPTLSDGTYYDAYTFYGHTHELVRFHLSSSEMDMYLLVVDGEGQVIAEDDDSGGGTDAMVEVEIPAEGTYQVLANTFFPGSTGEYLLVWEDPQTPFLSWGVPVEGELTDEDEMMPDDTYYDAYLLVGWEGETVRLSLSSPDMDTYLILTDTEGNWLAYDDDAGGGTDSYLEYTLPSSGAYRVLANTLFAGETGRYTLVWEAGPSEPYTGYVELQPGVSLEAEFTEDDLIFEDGSYFDTHFFEGRQGQELRLRLASSDVDAYLMLFDAQGNWLASDDDSGGGTDALIVLTLPEDGVYMVVANTLLGQETGRYTLTWEEAGSPEPGMIVEGALTPADPTLDDGSRYDSYQIHVRAEEEAGPLEPGMIVEGALTSADPTLDDGSHYDSYEINVQAGEVVRLYLASDAIDPFLILNDPGGVPWDHNDDSGSRHDALIDVAVPSAGTWEVVVTTFGPGETGGYLLAWAPPGVNFLTRGSQVKEELTADDPVLPEAYRHEFLPQDGAYHHRYLLVGRQGEVVSLGLESPELDPYLVLVDAEGNVLMKDDDSAGDWDALIEYTLPSTGVYQVLATSSFSGQTGRYTLSWPARRGSQEPGGRDQIGPGASVEGELTPDDAWLDDGTYYDLYYLEGNQGETVSLRLTSPDFDAYLMLRDEWGRRLAADDDGGGGTDAHLVHTLPADGWYQVVVNSVFRGETGRYTLTRETAAAEAEHDGGPTLALGVPVVGRLSRVDSTLDDGTFYDVWYLQGEAGQRVGIRLLAAEFDAYLMLWDETGEVIAADDDSGGGTNAFLEYTLPESGVYAVVVNSIFPGETGHYTLIWEAAVSTGEIGRVDGHLLPGAPVTGSTGLVPDHYRTYTLDVPEGVGSVVITLQSKGDLDLFARHGRQMWEWDEADFASVTSSTSETIVIDEESLRPGRYYIDVADLVRGSRGNTFALLATFRPGGDESEPTASRPPAEYVDGELVPGSRIQGRVDVDVLARYWAIEVPPGAQTLHAGLFNAEGPLTLVAAPEGRVPITPHTFPYSSETALRNDRLEIPVDHGEAARWWIGVVSHEVAPVQYELEVRFDEPLP